MKNRKTEDELNKLTPQRIKAYYRSLQKRVGKMQPRPCECCGMVQPEDELSTQEQVDLDELHKYTMFVKAIMKTNEPIKG